VGELQNDVPILADAKGVLAAVSGLTDLDEFVAKAEATAKTPLQARLLPPVAADGKVVPVLPQDRGIESVTEILAKAISELDTVGQLSDVVATEDGFHLLLLTEIIEPITRPLSSVREEVKDQLVGDHVKQRIDTLKKQSQVPIERRRSDMTALLQQVYLEK
jgi:hypothetical protein